MKIISLVIRYSCEDQHPPDGHCVCRTLAHETFTNEEDLKKFLLNKYVEEIKERYEIEYDDESDERKLDFLEEHDCIKVDEHIKIIKSELINYDTVRQIEEHFSDIYDEIDIYFNIISKNLKINII